MCRTRSDTVRRSDQGTPFLFSGGVSLSDVDKLWELQTVFTALNDREKQMSVKPESFAVVDREYQSVNEEVTRLQQQLDVLNKDRRRVDGELSDQQEMLRKYKGQLMQVKNQQ